MKLTENNRFFKRSVPREIDGMTSIIQGCMVPLSDAMTIQITLLLFENQSQFMNGLNQLHKLPSKRFTADRC